MKKYTYLKIITVLILVLIFTVCNVQAYENNESENSNFIEEHPENFIQSPLNNNFEVRFKDLFITKDISNFKSLPSISIQYNTTLVNTQEFYYNNPVSSAAKNFLQLTGTSF